MTGAARVLYSIAENFRLPQTPRLTCAAKLSPWFSERRSSTVEDIRAQLAYREENLQKLISRRYPTINPKIRDQLVKLYGELERKAESAEISDSALDLRGLLDAIALMEQGLSSGDALDMCIVNKSFDAYERGLIRDVIAARVPSDLRRELVFQT